MSTPETKIQFKQTEGVALIKKAVSAVCPMFIHLDGFPLPTYHFRHMLHKNLQGLGVSTIGLSTHSFWIGEAPSISLNGLLVSAVDIHSWYHRENMHHLLLQKFISEQMF